MLPTLTHLQFYVLSILMEGQKTGREVREMLRTEHGQKKTLAAFYQLMSRLEDSDLIKGWYESKHIDGVTIKERRYEILGAGVRALQLQDEFYNSIRRKVVFGGA
ncbi:hypothetical protein [Gimesia sp.]|uniref:hypothetical protein n=1 Tax=Gimesia sp. TaxID=2024833 RepID=UPI003A93F62A